MRVKSVFYLTRLCCEEVGKHVASEPDHKMPKAKYTPIFNLKLHKSNANYLKEGSFCSFEDSVIAAF